MFKNIWYYSFNLQAPSLGHTHRQHTQTDIHTINLHRKQATDLLHLYSHTETPGYAYIAVQQEVDPF
jgi:hypothetical protein